MVGLLYMWNNESYPHETVIRVVRRFLSGLSSVSSPGMSYLEGVCAQITTDTIEHQKPSRRHRSDFYHCGGFMERLVGLVKRHFKWAILCRPISLEQFCTVFSQIEGIVSGQSPFYPLSDQEFPYHFDL